MNPIDMPGFGGHEVTNERRTPPRRARKYSSSGSQRTFSEVRRTRSGKRVARIQDKGLCQTFGTYNTAEEVALASDEAARNLWEKEAITNFLTDLPPPTLPSELFDFQCSVLFANMDELWLSFRYTGGNDYFANIE
ncbi:hypothetical protein ACJRO7_029928 [Eucalyptus globulus]|uniref:AP2/ERF domain-containing protein n=1 Tax=Eucalyptus globulus TaxID=34317 RepID=A0ABD3JFW9_EUCGL